MEAVSVLLGEVAQPPQRIGLGELLALRSHGLPPCEDGLVRGLRLILDGARPLPLGRFLRAVKRVDEDDAEWARYALGVDANEYDQTGDTCLYGDAHGRGRGVGYGVYGDAMHPGNAAGWSAGCYGDPYGRSEGEGYGYAYGVGVAHGDGGAFDYGSSQASEW